MKTVSFNPLIFILLFTIISSSAQAIPAFARKEGMQCSGCHSAYPALNSMGRTYKTNGYRFSDNQLPGRKITDHLMLDSTFPISAGIVSRPYDKKGSGETKNRAIHEIEVMVGGSIGDNLSGFAELESEDEEGFNTSAAIVQATYNINPKVNVQVSRAPALYFDPYNSYTSSRRSSINRNVVIDQSFGGADNGSKLRKNRQNFTVFGRPLGNLFYGISYSGMAEDNQGVDASTYIARVAYDVQPSLMVGAMTLHGNCSLESGSDSCTTQDRDFSRSGVDIEWSPIPSFTLNGAYMKTQDDMEIESSKQSNNAYYLQAFYAFSKDSRPLIVPMLRFDSYEMNDGKEKIDAYTISLSHYMTENVKVRLEYWDRSGEGSVEDEDRMTVQFDALF